MSPGHDPDAMIGRKLAMKSPTPLCVAGVLVAFSFLSLTAAAAESAGVLTQGSPGRSDQKTASVAIDAAKVGPPISKYVYGQFIEHLGRCIYGGIWAEMLEDRKFFYPVGDKESPWKAARRRPRVDDGSAKDAFVGRAHAADHAGRLRCRAASPRTGWRFARARSTSDGSGSPDARDTPGPGPSDSRLGRRARAIGRP